MKSKPFKHYIPYILAGITGLFMRMVCCALQGNSYTMDGHDILNAVLLPFLLWCVLAFFATATKLKQSKAAARPRAVTSEGHGVCPRCENLVYAGDHYCQWCGQELDWSKEETG